MTANPPVIVVDGYSTGAYYLPLLEARGVPAVHIRSTPPGLDSHFTQVADAALDQLHHRYAALIDGAGDFDALCQRVAALKPRAVICGCESGVELADGLAVRLGLEANLPERRAARRDKHLMHQAVAAHGVRALAGLFTADPDEARAWITQGPGFPVVVKPARSSGTDGVYICRNDAEFETAFTALIGTHSFFGEPIAQVLVQECAVGDEVVVNTVSRDGKHLVSELLRYTKLTTEDGRPIYDGSELVADFGPATQDAVDYACAVLDALGIRIGPAHIELMLTERGPVLIECGARPMGGSFPQDLMRDCLGRTQLELSLEAYLDPEAFAKRFSEPYTLHKYLMIKCLISHREGALEAAPGVSLLTALPSVRRGNFIACLEHGRVHCTSDLFSSPANVFLCHEDPAVMHEDHALIRALEEEGPNLLFELEPSLDVTLDRDWFKLVGDDQWLKSEEEAAAEAQTVWTLLGHAPGLDVLDCPCGDGRISIHLAQRGARITGVDINPRFIERAQQRYRDAGLDAQFLVCDMRDLDFENRFDALVNWFNSFGYFDVETDFDVLKRLARALKPGGLLILEAPNRGDLVANTRPKRHSDGRDAARQWDPQSERLYASMIIEQHGCARDVVVGARMYSLAQYRLLFRLAGLEFIAVHGEGLRPYDDHAARMILLARKS